VRVWVVGELFVAHTAFTAAEKHLWIVFLLHTLVPVKGEGGGEI
jgi:hypothetical protein